MRELGKKEVFVQGVEFLLPGGKDFLPVMLRALQVDPVCLPSIDMDCDSLRLCIEEFVYWQTIVVQSGAEAGAEHRPPWFKFSYEKDESEEGDDLGEGSGSNALLVGVVVEKILLRRYRPETKTYDCIFRMANGSVMEMHIKRATLWAIHPQLSDIEQDGIPW